MAFIRSKTRSAKTNVHPLMMLACVVVLAICHKFLVMHPSYQHPLDDKSSSASVTAKQQRSTELVPADTTKPFVAIVSCITSNTDRHTHSIDDLLKKKLLPSVHATVSKQELDRFRIEILFGYDDNDEYWRQSSNQQLLTDLNRILRHNNESSNDIISLSFVPLTKDEGRPNHIPFNQLCQTAYDRGVQYLVRINDDTHFLSPQWLTLAVDTLRSFAPPNVGVVGPTCLGDASEQRDILTHDMTYLPYHLSVFDTYYPEVFDNYYIDDWISRVYSSNRTRRLVGWEMRHDTQAYGTRYRPSFGQDRYLEDEVEKGRKRVEKFVLELESKT